jgi:hypothetical protein
MFQSSAGGAPKTPTLVPDEGVKEGGFKKASLVAREPGSFAAYRPDIAKRCLTRFNMGYNYTLYIFLVQTGDW